MDVCKIVYDLRCVVCSKERAFPLLVGSPPCMQPAKRNDQPVLLSLFLCYKASYTSRAPMADVRFACSFGVT